jgi:hypothetical protein
MNGGLPGLEHAFTPRKQWGSIHQACLSVFLPESMDSAHMPLLQPHMINNSDILKPCYERNFAVQRFI